MADEFVGYEVLVDFIEKRALQELDGDIVEIGAYQGGGTVKLAKFAREHGKKVYSIDIFDTSFDKTASVSGAKACEVYEAYLYGRPMLEVYEETTKGFDNIITIKADSKKVEFPKEQKFFFGFVDGCHQLAYVRNDFHVIWPHLVAGGVIGIHDYKFHDWPEVTDAVDGLMDEYKNEISEVFEIKGEYDILSILLTKR